MRDNLDHFCPLGWWNLAGLSARPPWGSHSLRRSAHYASRPAVLTGCPKPWWDNGQRPENGWHADCSSAVLQTCSELGSPDRDSWILVE
eukprot:6344883-Pyramimonas_sp.AAC.1